MNSDYDWMSLIDWLIVDKTGFMKEMWKNVDFLLNWKLIHWKSGRSIDLRVVWFHDWRILDKLTVS